MLIWRGKKKVISWHNSSSYIIIIFKKVVCEKQNIVEIFIEIYQKSNALILDQMTQKTVISLNHTHTVKLTVSKTIFVL